MPLRKVQVLRKTKRADMNKMKNWIQQMKPVEMKRQAPEKVNQMKMKDRVPQKMVPREMPLRKVQVLRKTKRADMNKMKNWIQQMKPLRIQQMKPVEMKRQGPEKMNQMKMKDRVP